VSEAAEGMITDPVVERLDRLTMLLELALGPQLEQARQRIRADALDAAILDAAAKEWTPAAKLRQAVATTTAKKQRAIQIHVGELVERGFLSKRGSGNYVEYRSREGI
jgi:hypothetical protein